MVAYRQRFDYRFVLMAGDNIYEGPALTTIVAKLPNGTFMPRFRLQER